MIARRAVLLAVCAAAVVTPATALGGVRYAHPDAAGPLLSVSPDLLAASLECPSGQAVGTRRRVLLVSGTTTTPHDNFSWSVQPALTRAGVRWCAVTTPDHNLGEMQVAAEYVVSAIRRLHAADPAPIVILAHDQGGMTARWALRFWPDLRAMVSQVISIASFHHGTFGLRPLCAVGCAPALWQMLDGSRYVEALNSGAETFAGIAYTQVYTRTDEIGQPNLDDSGTSSLRTGEGRISNVATQEICPLNTAEHLGVGTWDPVSWAIVSDAIDHGGPADPARVDRSACRQSLMPGVKPATFPADAARTASVIATQVASHPVVAREPALACYTTSTCPQNRARASCVSRRVVILRVPRHLRGRLRRGDARVGRRVVATFGPRRTSAKLSFRGRPPGAVEVRLAFHLRDGRTVKAVRRFNLCARARAKGLEISKF